MVTLAELMGNLASDAATRGRQFERICKWYLENEPLFADQMRRVWLWDEWPGRWGADAGIDLVAEDREGRLWAVQATAYDSGYAVTKHDVDTFLSESSRVQFAVRLLVATTNHIGATARRTFEGQEKPVHTLLLAGLERSALDWPSSPSKLLPHQPKRKAPRPHQRRAIGDVVRGFTTADRGQLIMACGTGKTLAALWISEQLPSARTLVLLPSLSLLAQTIREWTANTPHPFEFLAVCSDETVLGEDAMVARTVELPYPVTTDPSEIARFLRRRGTQVVFATYQSSPKIAEAYSRSNRLPAFDLAIADEAHRCVGQADAVFGVIIDASGIHARRRLFMTATPRYVTNRLKKRASEGEFEIASMDDPKRFGPVFHRLTFADAIAQDLLSDYQVVVVVVDDETYRAYAERGEFVTIGDSKVRDARTLAAQIGLAKAMRDFGLHRVVSFHSRVDWARSFARSMHQVLDWMPEDERPSGDVWTAHVSGSMPAGERDVLLDRLRAVGAGDRGLLANARCLSEGVDVPTLDAVAFIDPRRSEVDVVQAVGRSIRKAEDKRSGTIVLPVFVGPDDQAAAVIETSAFEHVWQVLKALRAHDETLAEQLDEMRRNLGRRGRSGRLPEKIKLDLPMGLDVGFARAIDAQVVERTTAGWEFWFGLLQRFVEREGHSRVLPRHMEEGYRLGSWVFNQRGRRDQISSDHARLLESLPGWSWKRRDTMWEEGVSALERFVDREGHARVPTHHVEGGIRLGMWVDTQRQRAKDPERRSRLGALPGWAWNKLSADWEDAFWRLVRYAKRTGSARIPVEHVEDGERLGQWARKQRQAYRQGVLGAHRMQRLEALPGWTWSPFDDAWEQGYSALERFVDREGHARVPQGYLEGGFALGAWVFKQRQTFRHRTLGADRVKRLEALQGWSWSPHDAAWEEGYSALERFVDREGHARVPQAHVEDGFPVGRWVLARRQAFRRGTLGAERVRSLEALPGWTWSVRRVRAGRNQAGWVRPEREV